MTEQQQNPSQQSASQPGASTTKPSQQPISKLIDAARPPVARKSAGSRFKRIARKRK